MDSIEPSGEERFPHPVTIMHFNGRYFLIRGEEFLNQLLAGSEGYPTPVACVTATSHKVADGAVASGVQIADLWMINPWVMERLREDGHLVESVLEG